MVLSLGALTVRPQSGAQQPTFRGGAEIVVIDTQVVSRDGTPIEGLKPEQFEVFVDGRRRPVVSAEFVRSTRGSAVAARDPAPAFAEPGTPEGRVIVLGIDEASFPVAAQFSAREAARRVVDRVAPEDHLGMVALPGGIEIAPTRDRRPIREAVSRIAGARVDAVKSRFNLSAAEATQLHARASVVTQELICRECPGCGLRDQNCPLSLREDARAISLALEQQGMLTIANLHRFLDAMVSLPGRKTLIVVSAGLPMANHPGGRPNLDAETDRVARRAAAANINLYVFYMNVHFLRYFSPEYGKRNYSLYEDISIFGYGLEKFADSGGGAFFQIEVDSDPFVDRALRETSAFYLLAVRVEPQDRDGKEHFIRVSVKQRGATVRYRRIVSIPSGGG